MALHITPNSLIATANGELATELAFSDLHPWDSNTSLVGSDALDYRLEHGTMSQATIDAFQAVPQLPIDNPPEGLVFEITSDGTLKYYGHTDDLQVLNEGLYIVLPGNVVEVVEVSGAGIPIVRI